MPTFDRSLVKATWIQAGSAIVLSILTIFMLLSTIIQIKKQNDQYQVINRPIVLASFTGNGYVDQGAIDFINQGNLAAKDLMVAWSIVKLNGEKIIQEYSSDIFSPVNGKLAPEENFSIDFKSSFIPNDDPIFLVLVWAYNGPGIHGYRFRDDFFYWNTKNPPMFWVHPNPFDAKQRQGITLIKSKLKNILEGQIKAKPQTLCESCNES